MDCCHVSPAACVHLLCLVFSLMVQVEELVMLISHMVLWMVVSGDG